MADEYRNPWHSHSSSDPAIYRVSCEPSTYRGFQLFNRIPGTVCDIVREGCAIRQVVTVRAAKSAIDKILDDPNSFHAATLTGEPLAIVERLRAIQKAA